MVFKFAIAIIVISMLGLFIKILLGDSLYLVMNIAFALFVVGIFLAFLTAGMHKH